MFKLIYNFDKFLSIIPQKRKLAIYLDFSWIFEWLSLEYSLKVYDEKSHPRLKTLSPFLKKYIDCDSTVIDFGCSTGTMANFYADFCKNVIAIDFKEKDIIEAKRLYDKKNIEFICADAYQYLLSKQLKYDVLVFSHVVGYFKSPNEVFQKFKPFFKRIFIEVPDFDCLFSNHYRKIEKRDLIFMDNNYVHEFNREEILEEVEKSGLKVIDIEFRYGQIRIWCEC